MGCDLEKIQGVLGFGKDGRYLISPRRHCCDHNTRSKSKLAACYRAWGVLQFRLAIMRIQEFQINLVEKTRKQLPRALRNFEPRSFFSIVKIFYRNPKLHYEVWVRGRERLIEIGLHFEANKRINDALLAYFNSRSLEIHAELGPRIEIEQWTNSWSRVHEVVRYDSLNVDLADQLSAKLAKMITVLQPMLDAYKKETR